MEADNEPAAQAETEKATEEAKGEATEKAKEEAKDKRTPEEKLPVRVPWTDHRVEPTPTRIPLSLSS
jgi:hypothetical protein